VVCQKNGAVVEAIEDVATADLWVNGGTSSPTRHLDYLQPGEELVMEPFQRLMKEERPRRPHPEADHPLVTKASRLLLGRVVYQHAGVLLHIVVPEHQILG
jgi:hypothetical protein